MTTTRTGYLIRPLPVEALAEVRRTGLDAGGRPVERVTAEGGEPLRCCSSRTTPTAPVRAR